jgi:hypothetical protein
MNPHDDEVRLLLGQYVLDGTEAVNAIVYLVTSPHRPPDLRGAIRKILERHYKDCVPLDAIIDHIKLDESSHTSPERTEP